MCVWCLLRGVYITLGHEASWKEADVMYMFADNAQRLFSSHSPFFLPFLSIYHTPLKLGGGWGRRGRQQRQELILLKGCVCHKGGQWGTTRLLWAGPPLCVCCYLDNGTLMGVLDFPKWHWLMGRERKQIFLSLISASPYLSLLEVWRDVCP